MAQIKYLDSRRIMGASTDTVEAPTFEDDFSSAGTWTKTGTSVAVSGGVGGGSSVSLNTNDRLDQAVSITLSDSAFYCEFDFICSSIATARAFIPLSINDGTGDLNDGDCLTVVAAESSGNLLVKPRSYLASSLDADGTTITLSFSTQYYGVVKRTSTTSFTLQIYSDSARTSQVGSDSTITINSGVGSLDNVGTGSSVFGNSGETANYSVDNFNIWNGITSVTNKPKAPLSLSGCKAYYNFEQTSGSLTNIATTGNGFDDGLGSSADGTSTGASSSATESNTNVNDVAHIEQQVGANYVIGEQITSGNVLIGKSITSLSMWLYQLGTQTGSETFVLGIWDSSGSLQHTFGTITRSDIPVGTTYSNAQKFTRSTGSYVLQQNDIVGIKSVSNPNNAWTVEVTQRDSDVYSNGQRALFTEGSSPTTSSTRDVGFEVTYDVTGKVGSYAWDFDGINDYVSLGNNFTSFQGGDLTISLWAKITASLSGNQGLVTKDWTSHTDPYRSISIVNSNGNYVLWLNDNGSWNNNLITIASSPTTNVWHHIVVTRSGNTWTAYYDNNSVGSTTASPTFTTTDWEIGRARNLNYFDGSIDEVVFFNRALTSSEISALYNSGTGKAVNDSSLQAKPETNSIFIETDTASRWWFDGTNWNLPRNTDKAISTYSPDIFLKLDEGSGVSGTVLTNSGTNQSYTSTVTNGNSLGTYVSWEADQFETGKYGLKCNTNYQAGYVHDAIYTSSLPTDLASGNDYTFVALVKPSITTNDWIHMFAWGNSNVGMLPLSFKDKKLTTSYYNNAWYTIQDTNVITNDEWQVLGVTQEHTSGNQGTLKIFINGVKVASGTATDSFGYTDNADRIGLLGANGSANYLIYDCVFFKTSALSESQMLDLSEMLKGETQ